jgi:predicted nucleic acid-binding protein
LEGRRIAKNLGFDSHGTIGIVLRSFKDKKIEETIEMIEYLYFRSSLFFASDLKEWTIQQIKKFKG